ncbi:uncharacterized protein LOC129581713 [Paramacrobiotus metropolitanus]|uniref:uncharacterized protein LOC129581713 n=1 Tax=Paramacrobiotus metropolitanus TaxID=2943436 RepID=UPI0024465753|nr:uncharacterized protein LOC129581713 [Paramacrobiotus metropolitanus]
MWPEYPFTRELYISRQPIVQNRTLERECIGDADDAEQQRSGKKLQYIDACRMQETFSIVTVTETSDPKLAPSSDTVQRAVSLAFAQANPLTVGNASFSVKLTKRERLLPTFPHTVFRKGVSNQEPQVYRFTFSFSYVNLPRGKFWNIWRFPTDEIRQTLSALIPRIRSYHPFMSFTMYSSEPINVQLLPRLQETIKERLRVFHKYDESDVIIWDPDLNGTVVKFFVKNDRLFSSGIVDPRPDMGNDWVYREVGRLKFARNSMYHASDNNDALTLSQNKPRTDDGKQQLLERCRQEATVAASTACPLPANFSVFLMRKAGYGAPEILDTDAVLAGIVDAFAEANPVSMDGLDLNIALTGRSDGFLTAQGEPVVKFEFAATYREMETGNLWNFWRYPDDKILNNNLYNACAMVATMPFY